MCQKYKKICYRAEREQEIASGENEKILERLKETKHQLDAKDENTAKQLDLLSKKPKDMEQEKSEAAGEYEDRISNLKNTIRRNEEKREEERKADEAKFEEDKQKLERLFKA